MAKKTKKTETTAQPPAVVLREGKWVTADGLCFNTCLKAMRHIRELAAKQKPVKQESAKQKPRRKKPTKKTENERH